MKKSMTRTIILVLAIAATSTTPAFARMKYLKQFKAAYPNAVALFDCSTCHEGEAGDGVFNYYGMDIEKYNFDFKAVESMDSDGDGVSNIDEINAGTPPGVK